MNVNERRAKSYFEILEKGEKTYSFLSLLLSRLNSSVYPQTRSVCSFLRQYIRYHPLAKRNLL